MMIKLHYSSPPYPLFKFTRCGGRAEAVWKLRNGREVKYVTTISEMRDALIDSLWLGGGNKLMPLSEAVEELLGRKGVKIVRSPTRFMGLPAPKRVGGCYDEWAPHEYHAGYLKLYYPSDVWLAVGRMPYGWEVAEVLVPLPSWLEAMV